MSRHLTLHVRLLKGCQADCSYCSSWTLDGGRRMSPDEYARALRFVVDVLLPGFGCAGPASTVSVQYVGGEILLVPPSELRACVEIGREILGTAFGEVIDGAQSNLVASERRVLGLDALFGGRLGTSVDGRGTQRTVRGSADAYRAAVARSREALLRRRRRRPGAIFVVDRQGLGNVEYEIEAASQGGYQLILRPVFSGGRAVNEASVPELVDVLGRAFDAWAMRSRVPVEPFMLLLTRRIGLANATSQGSVCPFQRNCAAVSLDIEPDGTLFTCLDMADSSQFPLGNALRGTFDWDLWRQLRSRTDTIDPRCASCPFFMACQGGCMSEAIHHTGSPYGRSDLCAVWTDLFHRIDALVERHGRQEVSAWAHSLVA
jgi:radical SAM additional 4Fe4S-binding domain